MKFFVFKDGQAVKRFRVCGGHLFGTDGTSIKRVNISFQDGMVICQKNNTDTAGLALLWTVDGFGRILLPTTCLPERDRPYCLNVEIARARLMHTISREEEWSLFEYPDELEGISKQAQQLFVKSIQKIKDPGAASKLADGSLRKAMIFSEKLAMAQAENLLKNRRKARGFSRGCLGCQVDLDRIQEAGYVERLMALSPFVQIPMDWVHIEPQKGQFDFSKVDQCIEVLAHHRPILGAGPLLCFSPEHLPDWLIQGRGTFESVREAAYRFVMEVVTRYSRRIHRWFIISGINIYNHFGFDVEQVLELTRAGNMAVKAINNRAYKIVEVVDPWGQYYANTQNSIAPTAYMDMLIQSGVSFDAFALKMRFGKDQSGMYVRDLMQISSLLDYFSLMGKPLFITGVEIPSQHSDGPFDGTLAGIWHRPWDNRRQALWLEQFCITALGRPTVDAVVYGNLADRPDSVIAHSGLLTQMLEPKDAYRVLRKLRDNIMSQ